MTLSNKIDFVLVFRVRNANPNGDPLNGNRPRTDYNGFGEVTDVCLKRKLRDRLLESGQAIFVQSDDRKSDDAKSLKDRADKALGSKLGGSETVEEACKTWYDVRAFGQLFAFAPKKTKKGEEQDSGVSIGIRGPVSIHSAFSVSPVSITSTQITKSVNGDGDGEKRSSDTMGMKHRVDEGVYVMRGSINPQLAERTGFSDADADALKIILPKMFENDASSARPEGSMEVLNVVWWKHNCKAGQYSSAKVHQSVTVKPNGEVEIAELKDLKVEMIHGF
jgi:CRISPR-associated protein Csd2